MDTQGVVTRCLPIGCDGLYSSTRWRTNGRGSCPHGVGMVLNGWVPSTDNPNQRLSCVVTPTRLLGCPGFLLASCDDDRRLAVCLHLPLGHHHHPVGGISYPFFDSLFTCLGTLFHAVSCLPFPIAPPYHSVSRAGIRLAPLP